MKKQVIVFVDWNAQFHNAKTISISKPEEQAKLTLDWVVKRLSKHFKNYPQTHHTISLRFYHGWHKGFEDTENLKALRTAIPAYDFEAHKQKNVVFSTCHDYGYRMLVNNNDRIIKKKNGHLIDTLRTQNEKHIEKMIDTGLTCDVLEWARNPDVELAVIMGEDDDLIPAAITAESWVKNTGKAIYVLRKPRRTLLQIEGLVQELS